jgi:hypothetical protein
MAREDAPKRPTIGPPVEFGPDQKWGLDENVLGTPVREKGKRIQPLREPR